MSKLRVQSFTISLDGYGAGPDQELAQSARRRRRGVAQMVCRHPNVSADIWKGRRRNRRRRRFRRARVGQYRRVDPGPQHVRAGARAVAGRELEGLVGRHPALPLRRVRAHPPCRVRRSSMDGGTTFHFVTDGIEAALAKAKDAANGKDVRLGGGAATIRQYLRARPDRRDAYCHLAGSARARRAPLRRYRSAGARLRVQRARPHAEGHARRADQAEVDRSLSRFARRDDLAVLLGEGADVRLGQDVEHGLGGPAQAHAERRHDDRAVDQERVRDHEVDQLRVRPFRSRRGRARRRACPCGAGARAARCPWPRSAPRAARASAG